ncbi:tRNA 4-thiouridine(8) synthase ThiI [bacterium]|nr:tRNA 4-thiouridine(8) synthase ThiI [bacterium]
MPALLIVHYGEIALKGHNRKWFEVQLAMHLASALGGQAAGPALRYRGRLGVPLVEEFDPEKIYDAMSRVFGVTYYAIGRRCERNIDVLKSRIVEDLRARSAPPRSFAVVTRRSDKMFPMNSEAISREVGAAVHDTLGIAVDLDEPDLTIWISVTESDLLYSLGRIRGPGGLPANSAGRVLSLFSGGIDSPVSSFLLARRGAQVDLLHVHTYRTNAELVEDDQGKKILDLKSALDRHLVGSRLFLAPAYPFSIKAALSLGEKIEMILFRRFLLLLAQAFASRIRAEALVTGDNLGQVASQTLSNLAAVDFDLSLPVLRPLIAMDKVDIVALAKKISTYDISIRPYKDCCSLMSRHPRTRVPVELVKKIEADIGMPAMVEEALSLVESVPCQSARKS